MRGRVKTEEAIIISIMETRKKKGKIFAFINKLLIWLYQHIFQKQLKILFLYLLLTLDKKKLNKIQNLIYLKMITGSKYFLFYKRRLKKISNNQNGLNGQQYWNKVNGKGNLLMVFKSKSDYIFGAYSPCKWESNKNNYVEDNTLSSFIFLQTHDQVYPLKQDQKQYAIYSSSSYGPIFGQGHDIYITSDFTNGNSRLGYSYQFSQYKDRNDDPYLYGQKILEYLVFVLGNFQQDSSFNN
ncbi:unnamed protein product [Paramecium sonneborni]|uniref:TLDc domain-containing protein n=1 Tax=Paramecium sonneborni TaxID=65129 RepID=A0A8S1RRM0_9CILI|nr:unnamed protein product [Paramecium sonneborni]